MKDSSIPIFGSCVAVRFLLVVCISVSMPAKQAESQTVAGKTAWECHIIDDTSRGADGVKLADVNRDGFMDITTGWEERGLTRIYLNPGLGKVKGKWPFVTTGETRSVEDAVFVDLDEDGFVDVVSCCEGNSQSVFVQWAPKDKDEYLQESKWRSEVIPISKGMTRWMFCIPVQVDQKSGIDLVAGSKAPNAQIGWFEVPKDARNLKAYRWHTISPAGWIMSLRSVDMDSDGDLDILASDRKGKMRGCRWLENPGVGESQKKNWPNHFIGCRDKEGMFLTVADIDEDGLQEVLVAANTGKASEIIILRRLDIKGRLWKEYVIAFPEQTGTAKAVVVGDMNGDGKKDIVFSCENAKSPKSGLMWLARRKGVFDGDWQAYDISGPKGIKYDRMELLDVDGDGDPDVLACEERENGKGLGLFWYENPHPAPSPAKAKKWAISLTNYKNGTTIRYPVPLIRGKLADANATLVKVINTSSNRNTRNMEGLAYEGNFKVLAELIPGDNKLIIRAGRHELALALNYKPQTNPYIVRVFYLTDKTGNTEYQTPIENDLQDYRGKLGTTMKLMQTFNAERMNEMGFGRVTFNLEFDSDGRVKVHKLHADDKAEHYYKMDGLKLWSYAGRLISRRLPHPKAKNLVIPAFTRFDPNNGKTYAHTALGGGTLALFGGGNLFTWPDNLTDAQKAFMDTRTIDTKKFFSDSVGRHTFWATASTTIGAALHELGHTFGLPHSRHRHDIMTRGFDRFNRVFTLIEPPHARRKESYEFKESEIAFWADPSAVWLKFNRWFALDKKDFSERNKTTVTMEKDSGNILITSSHGIGGIVLAGKGNIYANFPIDYNKPPPQRVVVPLARFGRHLAGERPAVRVIDTQGLSKVVTLKELMPRSFIQSWRFASVTVPWEDPKSFVPVDSKRLKVIAASAASEKLSKFKTSYIDFLTHFPPERRQNVVAYAVRTFTSDKARDVRIFTGSDDALRVWLNGKLVTEALALRTARIDSESNSAKIRTGENTLVVEVSQGAGGWGLYLRIEDQKGNGLALTEDGKIVTQGM
ncbi:MAG: FG-GAP-like repeat-containing protein, partial [Planctomycetota bacterium]